MPMLVNCYDEKEQRESGEDDTEASPKIQTNHQNLPVYFSKPVLVMSVNLGQQALQTEDFSHQESI